MTRVDLTRIRVAAHNAHDQAAGVSRALDLCDLYLGNEAKVVTKPGWTIHKGGKGVITAWRNDLWLSAPVSEWHKAHSASALIPTPARGSLVSDGVLRGGRRVRVINGHRQNGTGWPGNKRRRFWRKRRKNWRAHDSMDRRLMFAGLNAGADVILGADVNRADMPSPHPTAVPLRSDGITQLWYIPAPGKPAFTSDNRGGIHPRQLGITGTTHRLQWADLTV